MQTYIVGGYVRDTLLQLTPNDIDYVVVGSTPAEMLSLGYEKVGRDFEVYLHPETKHEYALARTERSTGASHTDFSTETANVSLEEDLARRDLTINAIAMSETGTITDPYSGQSDIENRILRHTSEAFAEDPLRVLRLARLRATLPGYWRVHPSTKVLCHNMRPLLSSLIDERIWKELSKVMSHNTLPLFFETLYELNVLDVIFPSIHALILCREGIPSHREANVFVHTMLMLRLEKYSTLIQLSILFHDIGKPSTYLQYGNGAGHEGEAFVDSLLPTWIPATIRKEVLFLIVNHTRIYKFGSMKPSKIAKYIASYKKPYLLQAQIALANADDKGRICDPGISKDIPYMKIMCAHLDIQSYSPLLWISEQPTPPSGEAIKQHIHNYNIAVVKKYFTKD